jgi:hypothetical protein
MKKILIIENRLATSVWVQLLAKLTGNESVGLVVFNPLFSKFKFNFSKLYYIQKCNYKTKKEPKKNRLNTSRSYRYFGIDLNYEFYHEQVKHILDDFRPDIVVGECTHFYEILFVEECIKRNVPYVAPMATRYPRGRFEFLLFDTDYPIFNKSKNQNIVDNNHDIEGLVESIKDNSIQPNCINVNRLNSSLSFFSRLKIKLNYASKMMLTTLFYENAITPRVHKKIIKNLQTRVAYWKLEKFNLSDIKSGRAFFIYPMQLQPENNIDISGIEFSNQSNLINDLANFLEKYHIDLYVKPNPVLKYQVNKELVEVVNKLSNVYFLVDGISMKVLLDSALAVCSVTGTVLIEAAARDMNVFSFSKTRLSRALGIPILSSVNELANFMSKLHEQKKYSSNVYKYFEDVYKSSYEGHIYDPLTEHNVANDYINANKISLAFSSIIESLTDFKIDRSMGVGKKISFSGKI